MGLDEHKLDKHGNLANSGCGGGRSLSLSHSSQMGSVLFSFRESLVLLKEGTETSSYISPSKVKTGHMQ